MAPRPILAKSAGKVYNQLECRVCKERFWMTCKYLDHMSTHKHFSFSCNICNKGFSDQKQLDTHYITHKEVINTYDCKQCPRKFLQKSQLEQHIQFHFTSLTPNESSVNTKKAVHFSNILESKNISDDESSYSDSDFGEDYQFPKLTKTRSGRIVKVKKLFDNEPEVKRRRKSSDEVLKKDSENVEQSLRLKTVNETNFVTEKPSPPVSSSTSPKKVFNKKLVVLVEKIPDSVFESCVASGNVCELGSSSNQKSVNTYVSSDSQTKLLNHGSKEISKSFPVVTGSELSKHSNQNNSKVAIVSCDPESSTASDSIQRVNTGTASKKVVCKGRTDKAKTNTSSKSNVTSYKNSNTVASISTPQLPINSIQDDGFPAENSNSFLNNPSLPNQTNTKSYFYTSSPQVNKQFLYVGPKQDINKIKNIIEELKTMPTPNVQTSENKVVGRTNSSRLSQNICKENTPNVGNLNVDTPNKNSSGETGYESANGILEKTVLKDVILIKVTPELMQKMQRESLSTSQSQGNLQSLDATTVSPVRPKDLNQVSRTIEGNEMPELVQHETLQSEHENLDSFSTAKPANISSVSFSLTKTSSQVSHVVEKNETPELMPTVHRKTSVSSQKGNGNLKSFSACKPANISSVSSSLNKNSSKVSELTDKNRTPELMQKVHRKTPVSQQRRVKNLKSFNAVRTANISPVSSTMNKDLNKTSQVIDKNKTPDIMQKGQKKNLIFPQKGLGNLKSFSVVKTINTSSVSSGMNKKLSRVSRITEKHGKPELMQKVRWKNLVSVKKRCRNIKPFIVAKPTNILPVSSSENKDLPAVSQLRDKSETPELMQNVQKKNLMFPQLGHANSKSFSAVKTVNTSSVSSSTNKKLNQVSHITEGNRKPELMQKVHRKTLVPPQSGHKNLKSFIVLPPEKISPVSSSENKDLTEVSRSAEKNGLMQKVMSKTKVSLQRGQGNLKPSSGTMPVNISSVSASLNKDLTEVSQSTEKNRLMPKVTSETEVSLQRGHGNVEPSSAVLPANISQVSCSLNTNFTVVSPATAKKGLMRKVMNETEVSLQRKHNKHLTEISQSVEKKRLKKKVKSKTQVSRLRRHVNLEPSSAVMSANISPVSSQLNKDFPEVSQSTEKNRLIQNVKSAAQVSQGRGHKNLESSSIVTPVNISPVTSSVKKNLTEISQSIEKNGLKRKVKSKTPVSRRRINVNLEPSSAVMSANISPVSSQLNKDFPEVSQSTEKNRLIQNVKSAAQVSQGRGHKNLESSSIVTPVNISPVTSSVKKNLTEISQSIEKNGLKRKVKSKTPVSRRRINVNLEPSSAVKSANISPVSSHLNKGCTEVSQSTEKNILIQNVRSEAQVSLQMEHGNLEPSYTVPSTNISLVSSPLNKDLTKVSQSTEKNILMQNVKSGAQVSQGRGHKNLESSSIVTPVNISPVISSVKKKLTEISQAIKKNRLKQKVKSKTPVSRRRRRVNLEPSSAVKSANISPVSSHVNKGFTEVSQSPEKNILIQNVKSEAEVSLQRGHRNLELSSTVMSANILPVSSSLNKDITEVSQSTEKNILIQNVKSEAQVSPQKWHGNLEPSSTVMSANISPVSSSLNKDVTEVPQLTEKDILIQNVKSEAQVSQQVGHGNLEPCRAVLSTDISPVSSTLNKDLTEVSQSREKNGIPKLLQEIKRETPEREHGNLEPFHDAKPANICPVSSSLNKELIEDSHTTSKNRRKGILKSPEVVITHDSKIVDKSLKSQAVNCGNSETLTICQVTSNGTPRKTAKISEQDIAFNISIDKKSKGTASSQTAHPSSSREEKLLARYKAKIEEKERKKREKYELKKRMRFVEKIRCMNNTNLTELMQVFREAHNESSVLAGNLEGDSELPLQSKAKTSATEIVPNLENEESLSGVNDKNLATTSVRSKKYPSKKGRRRK